MQNIRFSNYIWFLVLICLTLLSTCLTQPPDPFTDRNNINATTTLLMPASICKVGDTIRFELKVDLPDFIDSVQVLFGDDSMITLKKSEFALNWTKEISHIYSVPGKDSLYAVIYENNNTHKRQYQLIVNIKTYIVYHGNESTGGSIPVDSNLYEKGQSVTIKGNSGGLVKTDHVFSGWNTKPDGSGAGFNGGEDNYIVDSQNVLYAHWTQEPTYTVTYNGNGNTGGTTPVDSNSYEDSVSIILLGNTGNLVKTGYTFAGWNTQADGNGATYASSAVLKIQSANVELYAKWTQNPTYSVIYNGNGNTSGRVPVDYNAYETGTSVTVKGNTGNLAKTLNTFAGWNTEANGTGVQHAVGTIFTIAHDSVVLYAQWTTIPTYKVTYNGNGNTGGSVPVDVNAYKAGAIVTVKTNSGLLVKSGYFFAGWNTASDATGTGYAASDTVTFEIGSANVVLYAKWNHLIIILPPIQTMP